MSRPHSTVVRLNRPIAIARMGAVVIAVRMLLPFPQMARAQQPLPAEGATTAADSVSASEASPTEEQLRVALEARPGDPELHARLAELLLENERNEEAYAGYLRATQLDPRNAGYRYGLATAALVTGRLAEAETQYAWGAQLDPEDAAMQVGLGEAALARGHPELAAPHFRRAIELADSAPAIRLEAEALLTQANREAAGLSRGLPAIVQKTAFYLSVGAMAVAGLALLIATGEGILLLFVIAPLMGLTKRDRR